MRRKPRRPGGIPHPARRSGSAPGPAGHDHDSCRVST
jgi:hypothetical protein